MVNKENIYQRREVDLGEIVNRIKIDDNKNIPDIILTIGHCRSGTTALLRLFGATGIDSYFQPIKTILRWLLQDEDKEMAHTWTIPKGRLIYVRQEHLRTLVHHYFHLHSRNYYRNNGFDTH